MITVLALLVLPNIYALCRLAKAEAKALTLTLIFAANGLYVSGLPTIGLSIFMLFCVAIFVLRQSDVVRLCRDPRLAYVICFLAFQAMTLVYAPQVREGLRWIASELPFLAAFLLTSSKSRLATIEALITGLIASLGNALLVIYFYSHHDSALTFYQTKLAALLIGPGVRDLFTAQGANNVLDPDKSGGLLLNANVASLYCGVVAVLAYGIYRELQRRSLLAVAVLSYVAVFFTGSKTGLFLGISSIAGFHILSREARMRRSSPFLLTILFLGTIGTSIYATTSTSPGGAVGQSLSIRHVIWGAAIEIIQRSPIFGQGFGGWTSAFRPYAILHGFTQTYPPHNLILYTWSQSGLIGVTLLAASIAVMICHAYRASRDGSVIGRVTLVAFLWTFLHGMADNTTIFGDIHTAALLGTAIAITLSPQPIAPMQRIRDRQRQKEVQLIE